MCNELYFIKNTIAITNRKLVKGDYFAQIKKVAALHPYAIILREKDLDEIEYEKLAKRALEICEEYKVPCFLHSKLELANSLGCENIHIPIAMAEQLCMYPKAFKRISIACHSLFDVKKAIECKATQIVLGTIFETQCKPGLKGSGLPFVKEVCEYCKSNGDIPVFAIGGVNPSNVDSVIDAGAYGGCMMSYMMEL